MANFVASYWKLGISLGGGEGYIFYFHSAISTTKITEFQRIQRKLKFRARYGCCSTLSILAISFSKHLLKSFNKTKHLCIGHFCPNNYKLWSRLHSHVPSMKKLELAPLMPADEFERAHLKRRLTVVEGCYLR